MVRGCLAASVFLLPLIRLIYYKIIARWIATHMGILTHTRVVQMGVRGSSTLERRILEAFPSNLEGLDGCSRAGSTQLKFLNKNLKI